MPTQREQALNMIAQLRLIDPSISAEVGTPERKIIDVVAQALTDSQIDLAALQGALDVDSKFGANLDRFVSLFGFGRQAAMYATGFVTFGRLLPSALDIQIPAGSRVMAVSQGITVIFATTFTVTLSAGETEVTVPIRAIQAGSSGNVAAGAITTIVGTDTIYGITTVTNTQKTSSGKDAESDNQLKVRFKNTIFRNLAGTEDQYLALAVSAPFSTKANVVGPISRYQEYIQVPEFDDSVAYDIDGDAVAESGNGVLGEYTSALSSIPFSKYHYAEAPIFVSNGDLGTGNYFYRRDVDYRINISPSLKDRGDTRRLAQVGRGLNPITNATTNYQPNVTFLNIYTGDYPQVQAVRPNDVVLFEHSYLSSASRNDITRNVTNAVDVYIDGGDISTGTVILPHPTTTNLIVDNPASKYHYENYRRSGQAERRPLIGNLLMPLMNQPVFDVPELIDVVVGELTYTFERDVHYWAVEDVSILGGSIRSRSGIEWNMDKPAQLIDSPDIFITDPSIGYINIDGYSYDRSVGALQEALDEAKQITTDVLAHRAKRRYFKLDITVMYELGTSIAATNDGIQLALQDFLVNQYFGSVVQLSDLLQVIHGVSGVDNVRWTSDVPTASGDFARVIETDRFGRPLTNVQIDVRRKGRPVVDTLPGLTEIQQMVISGSPTAGNYALRHEGVYTTALAYNTNAAGVRTALLAIGAPVDTVTGTGSPADPFVITFAGVGERSMIQSTPVPTRVISPVPVVGGFRDLYGKYVIDSDFFLKDDELISLATEVDETTLGALPDTVPGLLIRPRAQNTWSR